MWLPNRELLASPEVDQRSLFLLQAWHELLSTTIPDTFRARVLDFFLLIDELEHIVSLARDDDRWLAHVVAICEEVKDEQGEFLRMVGRSPEAVSAVMAISDFKATAVDLLALKERIQIVRSLAGDSRRLLIEDLRSAAAIPSTENSDLLRRLGPVATHVQRLGLAGESVSSLTETLTEALVTRSPAEVADILCAPLLQEPRTFSCFVAVLGPVKDATRIFHGSEFPRIGKKRLRSSALGLGWYESNRDSYMVQVEVQAMSNRQAAEKALVSLNTLLNLVALYANEAKLSCSSTVLTQQDAVYSTVEVVAGRHFGLRPRKDSVGLARSRVKALGGRLTGRLGNILETHSLGIASDDPRSAVINLWTALEAIAGPSRKIQSIGERVAAAVAPTIAWRRVDKVVTYLAINMVQLSKVRGVPLDLTHLPNSTQNHVNRSDLLACLTGPRDNPGVLSLFAQCSSSPLLNYQLFFAWKTCSSHKELRSTLQRSERRVRWQILRLYRVRNLLVHRGEMNDLVWRLLENAQYYVSTVMGRVLHNMTVHATWSVDTAIEFQRQRFASLVERLERQAGDGVTFSDLLVYDSVRSRTPVWGGGSPFGVA